MSINDVLSSDSNVLTPAQERRAEALCIAKTVFPGGYIDTVVKIADWIVRGGTYGD